MGTLGGCDNPGCVFIYVCVCLSKSRARELGQAFPVDSVLLCRGSSWGNAHLCSLHCILYSKVETDGLHVVGLMYFEVSKSRTGCHGTLCGALHGTPP